MIEVLKQLPLDIEVGRLVGPVSDEEIQQIQALQQADLYREPVAFDEVRADVDDIVSNTRQRLFVGAHAGELVAMTLLTTWSKTGTTFGYIDDVATLPAHRGRGVSSALNEMALEFCRASRIKKVELTSDSRVERQAAHHVYGKLGYKVRDTSVFTRPVDGD